MKQWRIVFFIAAIVYIFCATFYNIFGSGKRQAWDNPLNDDPTKVPMQNIAHPVNTTTTLQIQTQNGHPQTQPQANGNGVYETRQ